LAADVAVGGQDVTGTIGNTETPAVGGPNEVPHVQDNVPGRTAGHLQDISEAVVSFWKLDHVPDPDPSVYDPLKICHSKNLAVLSNCGAGPRTRSSQAEMVDADKQFARKQFASCDVRVWRAGSQTMWGN
jgi:hypothetical protein